MRTEQWKAIAGHEGRYEVSDHGRVRSLDRIEGSARAHRLNGKVLRPGLTSVGYPSVVLYLDGARRTHLVHRLVAAAFIENPSNLPEVNHDDGVKTNCLATNLEWCTGSQNVQHAYDTGLMVPYDRRPVADGANQLVDRARAYLRNPGPRVWISEHGAVGLPLGHPSRLTTYEAHDCEAAAYGAAAGSEFNARVFSVFVPPDDATDEAA